ncbi:MAG: hypothetical protein ACLR08_10600 [Dorea longicatena]
MGEIDVMEVKMDLMEVMKENKTSMPQGAYDAGKTCGNRTLGDSCF